jgi:hypothetical protein
MRYSIGILRHAMELFDLHGYDSFLESLALAAVRLS